MRPYSSPSQRPMLTSSARTQMLQHPGRYHIRLVCIRHCIRAVDAVTIPKMFAGKAGVSEKQPRAL